MGLEGEVTGLSGPVSDGQLVDVISRRGSWLGCGFFNSRSRIRVRVLSRNPNDRFDRAFCGGASSTHGTIARPSWGRRIAAAAG